MATAAPAPAAPATGQAAAEAGPQTAAPGTQAGESPAGEPKPRAVPKLPGVMDDGPETVDRTEEVRARAGRDERGRFVKGGEGAVEQPRDPLPEPPKPPEPKKPFRFADQDFDDQRAAELAFKSERGKLQPVQRKLAEVTTDRDKAAESARGWHARAQELEARIAELQAGRGEVAPGTPDPQSQPAEGGIDWGLYAEIVKAANEAGEPWKAQQWLQEQYDASIRAEFARLRDEAIEQPRREAAEQAALTQTADTLVSSMAAQTNPDGSPTFPELADGPGNEAEAVGALWVSLGLDPRAALTPGGAVAAVALYRMAKAMNSPAAPAPTSAPPAPNPAAEAAAALDAGRPLAPVAADYRGVDPTAARIVSGLKNTQLIRPGLGFEA